MMLTGVDHACWLYCSQVIFFDKTEARACVCDDSAATAIDLAGSIAVDDDGFIYVADVGNRRIQKFAP